MEWTKAAKDCRLFLGSVMSNAGDGTWVHAGASGGEMKMGLWQVICQEVVW